MTALLLVDLQNDFMPGGSLPVPNGKQILPAINRLLQKKFDLIIASKDWHPENHGSFASIYNKNPTDIIQLEGVEQILWPIHCVKESEGAAFVEGWDHTKVNHIVFKGIDKKIDSYSAFFDNASRRSTGLFDLLKEKSIQRLYVAGLATDYCVKYSVLDALRLGFKVFVVTDGCAAVNLNSQDGNEALRVMEEAGACLIDSIQEIQT